MKKHVLVWIFIISSVHQTVRGQIEYKFEYIPVHIQRSGPSSPRDAGTCAWTFNGKTFQEKNRDYNVYGHTGFLHEVTTSNCRIMEGPSNGTGNFLLLEKATRIDNQAVESRFNARLESMRSEFESRINTVAVEKAKSATDTLRIRLLEAVKDAKLFDEEYKRILLQSIENKFQAQIREAIEQLKNEIKPTK